MSRRSDSSHSSKAVSERTSAAGDAAVGGGGAGVDVTTSGRTPVSPPSVDEATADSEGRVMPPSPLGWPCRTPTSPLPAENAAGGGDGAVTASLSPD